MNEVNNELIPPCPLCNCGGVISGNEYCECIYGELDRWNDRCESLIELLAKTKKELESSTTVRNDISRKIRQYALPTFDKIQSELVGFTHIHCLNRMCKHHRHNDKYGCDIHGMGLDNNPSPCNEYIDYKKFYKAEYDAYLAKQNEKRQQIINNNVGSEI